MGEEFCCASQLEYFPEIKICVVVLPGTWSLVTSLTWGT